MLSQKQRVHAERSQYPMNAAEALRRHKASQNELRVSLGPAFGGPWLWVCDVLGKPWLPDGISTLFRSILTEAELRHVRFHDLRHYGGIPIAGRRGPNHDRGRNLGTCKYLYNAVLYSHAIQGGQEAAAMAMGEILKDAFGGR
ncbi:MAG: hypothetical protein M3126_03465 [Candidatus Eremiobacteraeota bacterium]|nr:hypothetical protein [Candidatus Eremiobacteraeota bacterium]